MYIHMFVTSTDVFMHMSSEHPFTDPSKSKQNGTYLDIYHLRDRQNFKDEFQKCMHITH